jgi:hypothetical protein
MRTFPVKTLDNAPDRCAKRRLVRRAQVAMGSHAQHEWQAPSRGVRHASIALHGLMLPATMPLVKPGPLAGDGKMGNESGIGTTRSGIESAQRAAGFKSQHIPILFARHNSDGVPHTSKSRPCSNKAIVTQTPFHRDNVARPHGIAPQRS